MTEDELRDYLAAFNARDYATVLGYFHPEVELFLPPDRVLRGPSAIQEHYASLPMSESCSRSTSAW